MALRTNIDRIVYKKNISRGFQREKIEYLYLKLVWDSNDLEKIINNRLKLLMKEVYTNRSPTIYNILPDYTKKRGAPFQYMIDRTLMRPRDILAFFNKCILHSNGKIKFSWEIIQKGEEEYSRSRLRALNDEWLENHGNIYILYGFLKGQNLSFTLSDLHDKANSYFVDAISNEEIKELSYEWQQRFNKFGNEFKPIPLLKEILATLHNIGLLGIKADSEHTVSYIHQSYNLIEPEDIDKLYPKFYVHPTFWKALNLKMKT